MATTDIRHTSGLNVYERFVTFKQKLDVNIEHVLHPTDEYKINLFYLLLFIYYLFNIIS